MGNQSTKQETVELPDGGSLVPSGIYPVDPTSPPEFDNKSVKKFILDKKLSPFYQPSQEESPGRTAECPICFLYFPEPLNRSRCCDQPICTECFLQIKQPQSGGPATCPFCVEVNYGVTYNIQDKNALAAGTSTMGVDTRKEVSRRKSIPKNAPNVVTTDMVRPMGRRQSGIISRYNEAARRLRSSSTNNSPHRVSVRFGTTFAERGYITAAQLETNWERIMLEQAIRQSILDEEERVRREEQQQQQQQQQGDTRTNANAESPVNSSS